MMDWTKVMETIITLAVLLISGAVIPWIKTKVSDQRLQMILAYVEIAVGAAEQIFEVSEGDKKKAWVMEWIADHGINVEADTLSAMIENAVITLHNELKA